MGNHIHKTAKIDKGCEIGHHIVICERVVIGAGCRIGHHVVIHQEAEIGEGVRIDDHTVIGKHPMKAAISAMTNEKALEPSVIKEGCIIGTGAVVYRGCSGSGGNQRCPRTEDSNGLSC